MKSITGLPFALPLLARHHGVIFFEALGGPEVLVSDPSAGVYRAHTWQTYRASDVLFIEFVVLGGWLLDGTLEDADCAVVVHGDQVVLVHNYVLHLRVAREEQLILWFEFRNFTHAKALASAKELALPLALGRLDFARIA